MYRIPTEEEVRNAIYLALKKRKSIPSLVELRKRVLIELKKLNKDYTISHKRVRIITARSGFVKISTKMKTTNKKPKACPICGGKLYPIKNYSLLGEEVVTGYKCKLCSYRTGAKNEIPVRYSFHLAK